MYRQCEHIGSSYPLAKFIGPDWRDKDDSEIVLPYRPARLHGLAGRYENHMPESTYPRVVSVIPTPRNYA
jgi:hypothetical protein